MNDPIPTPVDDLIPTAVLDAIGGEPLADSGFEAEEPDDSFVSEREVSRG
jgi:hypothetical protein